MDGLRIGELARLAGCTVKAIRFYEARGLLPRAARSASGYRLFTDRDARRLQFIQRAKLIGLSLAKIRELVDHLGEQDCGCATLRPHLEPLIRQQLQEVRARLGQLALLQEELEALLAKLRRGRRSLPAELCACGPHRAPARPVPTSLQGGRR